MKEATQIIGPGSTIGILGAGQLGRMLTLVARRMGYNVAVFGGDSSSPCGHVSDRTWPGDYSNESSLREFASACDVVTYEFENIPSAAASIIESVTPLRPGVKLLNKAQNRFAEKTALTNIGLQTAQFRMVRSSAELTEVAKEFGRSVILKANTDGYDGKGQWSINAQTDLEQLWNDANLEEAIVEQKVDFQFELSILGGRFPDGTCQFFDPFLNHHANHILDVTISGASEIDAEMTRKARQIGEAVLQHFEVIGVLCIELFLTNDGQLLVNEIAPRPHNSGHVTIEAYNCSQFELQLRTICGLPAVALNRRSSIAAMSNLLGQHLPQAWSATNLATFSTPDVHLHLYGKAEARTNRKMGHITAIGDDAEARVRAAREAFLADSLKR